LLTEDFEKSFEKKDDKLCFAFAEWGLFFKQSFEIRLQLKTSENKLSDVLVRNHESAS